MRNITGDLEERLVDVEAERSRLQRQLDALAGRESILRSMLETELTRLGQQQQMLPQAYVYEGNGHGPADSNYGKYGNFLIQSLDQGERDLAYLKRLASDMQIDFGDKSPGRALHFALVGLQRRGLIKRTVDDSWQLVREEMQE